MAYNIDIHSVSKCSYHIDLYQDWHIAGFQNKSTFGMCLGFYKR